MVLPDGRQNVVEISEVLNDMANIVDTNAEITAYADDVEEVNVMFVDA